MNEVVVERFDPFDDDPGGDLGALRTWYDAYREAVTHERPFHAAWAFEELRAQVTAPDPRRPRVLGWARAVDGTVLGVTQLSLSEGDNRDLADVEVCVVPAHRRQGVGTQLLEQAEQWAREAGRERLVAETSYPFDAADEGRGEPGPEFALARGFAFGIGDVQRELRLPVPAAELDALAAESASGPADYPVHRLLPFVGEVPDVIVESWARLVGHLMTEAPMGGVQREPEAYDVDRVRDGERLSEAQGRTRVATAAITRQGEVVGFTELMVAAHEPGVAYQWGTLVRGDHRGHRLGLAMKTAALALLQSERPEVVLVRTWNADDNAPMVAVNDRLGYRPVARLGEFVKSLA